MTKLLKNLLAGLIKIKKVQSDEMIKPHGEDATKGDLMDYDGMGDWGRIPPIRKY